MFLLSKTSPSVCPRADNLKVGELVEVVEPVQPAAVVEPLVATNGQTNPVPDCRQRSCPALHHNWSDLLFIMDLMEDNAVDPCDILIFISKSDDLITVLEDKKVDIHQSRLDVATNTLSLAFTDAGIIEKLLGKNNVQPPPPPSRCCNVNNRIF